MRINPAQIDSAPHSFLLASAAPSEVLGTAPKATAYAGAADIPQIKSSRPIKAVGDNDEVFGLRVIATPGHIPDHVCLFDPAGSLLILGDAMNNIGSKLDSPNP